MRLVKLHLLSGASICFNPDSIVGVCEASDTLFAKIFGFDSVRIFIPNDQVHVQEDYATVIRMLTGSE